MFSSCLRNDEDYSNDDFLINIKVDPTIELFCTIQRRLANTDQNILQINFTSYISDIEEYFEKFQNHDCCSPLQSNRRNQNSCWKCSICHSADYI